MKGSSLHPCFLHCGRGKEKMGEEVARARCPRNLPATHVCLYQLTAVPRLGQGGRMKHVQLWVFSSEMMGAMWLQHRAAEGRRCLSLLGRTAEPQAQ